MVSNLDVLLLAGRPKQEYDWLGAHSWVRKSFNIGMDGEQTSQLFLYYSKYCSNKRGIRLCLGSS